MYICGREVKAIYLKDMGIFYIELLLAENDCPEKKKFPDVQFCPGDCQGTYISAIVENDVVKIIGSIYPKPHIMYNEKFVKKHNIRREKLIEFTRDYLSNNSYTVESSMGGRKKRIYVGKEHIQTIFDGCVFRMAQGEFAKLLTTLRKKELSAITENLDKIKKIAIPATTKDFKKFAKF